MSVASPLVTIGITAYNAQNTIERAVTSALMQDWANTEIIIVDDFSSDHTFETLKKFACMHENIRVIQNPENSGVAMSRNVIITEAKGEFIAFFDDDDESLPQRLTLQVLSITACEKQNGKNARALCHSARRQIYPDGSERIEGTMALSGSAKTGITVFGHAVAARILWGEKAAGTFGSLATCSQMARTKMYRDLEGFDPSFRRSEDTEFNVRAARAGVVFIGVAEPCVIQTMTLSGDKKLEQEKFYFLKILTKHQDYIAKYRPFGACVAWVDLRYAFLQRNYGAFALNLFFLIVRHPVFTLHRIVWAFPNLGFNIQFSKFNRG